MLPFIEVILHATTTHHHSATASWMAFIGFKCTLAITMNRKLKLVIQAVLFLQLYKVYPGALDWSLRPQHHAKFALISCNRNPPSGGCPGALTATSQFPCNSCLLSQPCMLLTCSTQPETPLVCPASSAYWWWWLQQSQSLISVLMVNSI